MAHDSVMTSTAMQAPFVYFCWSEVSPVLQIDAIFRHESQKDRALFPGADPREFWQRAKDRNKVPLPWTHTCIRLQRQLPYCIAVQHAVFGSPCNTAASMPWLVAPDESEGIFLMECEFLFAPDEGQV